MSAPSITPQHILGGIAFEARAIFSAIDGHAAGAPINIAALKDAVNRMHGLAVMIDVAARDAADDARETSAEAA